MTSSTRPGPSLGRTGTHYETLGVAPSADVQELRRAYRSLARELHPDRQQQAPPAQAAQAAVRMGEVNAAWAVLSNPSARELYDLELRLAASRAAGGGATSARPAGSGPPAAGADHHQTAAAPRYASLDDEPLRYQGGSGGHPVVRSLLWLAVLGTLAAIFVFTAYAAGGGGGDDPAPTTTTVAVPQAEAGDCVNAAVPNAFDLVSCTGPHDARIVEMVPIGRPCPAGAREVYLPQQHEPRASSSADADGGRARRSGPGTSRAVTAFSRVVLGTCFREVEVQGRANLPAAGPVVLVANHANGLVDPLLVIVAVGHVPRFLAKAAIFRAVPLRPALRQLGLLPVVRRQDVTDGVAAGAGPHPTTNRDTFAQAQRALADGALVAMFPEGTAHDEPHLLPLRTGAARLALGARAEGAVGLRLVPVGLVFDDKLALRSRALAVIGTPIDLDAWVVARGEPAIDDTDRPAVEDLTTRLARALTEVVPTAESVEEAWALSTAAGVVARDRIQAGGTGPAPGAGPNRVRRVAGGAGRRVRRQVRASVELDRPPRLSASTAIVQSLVTAANAHRAAVRAAADAYRRALEVVGLRDEDLASSESSGRLVRRAVLAGLRTIGLLPWAAVGAALNAVPYAVVRLAGRRARKPAALGTARILAGAVSFPLTWLAVGLVTARRRSPWLGVAAATTAGVSGWITVVEFERIEALRRSWRGRTRRLGVRAQLDALRSARRHLVDVAEAALDAVPGAPAGSAPGPSGSKSLRPDPAR